jgi:hypothetical protein
MFDKNVKNHNKNIFLAIPVAVTAVFTVSNIVIAQPIVSMQSGTFVVANTTISAEEDEDPSSAKAPAIWSPESDNSLLENIISAEAHTLSVDEQAFAQTMNDFAGMVKYIESTGKQSATNPYSGAMSYYQFLPNSVITAVNRLEIFMTKHEMGRIPMWAVNLRNDPKSMYNLSLERQTIIMLVNIFEQRGSDVYLAQMMSRDMNEAKNLYYIYHHTAPDPATISLTEKTYDRYFD